MQKMLHRLKNFYVPNVPGTLAHLARKSWDRRVSADFRIAELEEKYYYKTVKNCKRKSKL